MCYRFVFFLWRRARQKHNDLRPGPRVAPQNVQNCTRLEKGRFSVGRVYQETGRVGNHGVCYVCVISFSRVFCPLCVFLFLETLHNHRSGMSVSVFRHRRNWTCSKRTSIKSCLNHAVCALPLQVNPTVLFHDADLLTSFRYPPNRHNGGRWRWIGCRSKFHHR